MHKGASLFVVLYCGRQRTIDLKKFQQNILLTVFGGELWIIKCFSVR